MAYKNYENYKKRKEITRQLSDMTEALLSHGNDPMAYWAREVTFDSDTAHAIRVDYMRFRPAGGSVGGLEKGDFICYEVKSSVEDFHSKNGHNFLGDYNYYVMPEDVFKVVGEEIPWNIGVYCPVGNILKVAKSAKRTDRARPVSEMLFSMFRSVSRDLRNTKEKTKERTKEKSYVNG